MTITLTWGKSGATEAAARGDAVVIVDVLRFSTTVAAAVDAGAVVYPVPYTGGSRPDISSLSPGRLAQASGHVRLGSLNGSECLLAAAAADPYVAALVNARAVAEAVSTVGHEAITLVACGELNCKGELRFAEEDLLGAGAVISWLDGEKLGAARVAQNAFLASDCSLESILLSGESGQELIERGLRKDVLYAAQLDTLSVVPRMLNGSVRDINQPT